jgi:hypothetical protein
MDAERRPVPHSSLVLACVEASQRETRPKSRSFRLPFCFSSSVSFVDEDISRRYDEMLIILIKTAIEIFQLDRTSGDNRRLLHPPMSGNQSLRWRPSQETHRENARIAKLPILLAGELH